MHDLLGFLVTQLGADRRHRLGFVGRVDHPSAHRKHLVVACQLLPVAVGQHQLQLRLLLGHGEPKPLVQLARREHPEGRGGGNDQQQQNDKNDDPASALALGRRPGRERGELVIGSPAVFIAVVPLGFDDIRLGHHRRRGHRLDQRFSRRRDWTVGRQGLELGVLFAAILFDPVRFLRRRLLFGKLFLDRGRRDRLSHLLPIGIRTLVPAVPARGAADLPACGRDGSVLHQILRPACGAGQDHGAILMPSEARVNRNARALARRRPHAKSRRGMGGASRCRL